MFWVIILGALLFVLGMLTLLFAMLKDGSDADDMAEKLLNEDKVHIKIN